MPHLMINASSLWVAALLLAADVVGHAPARAAKPAPPPLSATGQKLEAEYTNRLAELRAQITKAPPVVKEASRAAYAAARQAEFTAKADLAKAAATLGIDQLLASDRANGGAVTAFRRA